MTLMPMTRIALRNLFSKPATRLYPFVIREPFAGSRGSIQIDYPTCTHCTLCAKHCPANAIVVDRVAKTWSIDRFACVTCGACVRVCSTKSLSMATNRAPALAFGDLAKAVESHSVAELSPKNA